MFSFFSVNCIKMKKDLDVLLDCIGLQLDNRNNLKQSLLTIANMCAGNGEWNNWINLHKIQKYYFLFDK